MIFSIKHFRLIINKLPPHIRRKIIETLPSTLLRWYECRSTDAYVISFPKCGRTWLKLMLGKALASHFNIKNPDLLEVGLMSLQNDAIPHIKFSHDDNPHFKKATELTQDKNIYKNSRVIFLIRDPRDVIVSLYFQKTKRDKIYDATLSDFLYEEVGSLDSLIRFYNIWASNRHLLSAFKIVQYEKIHANPEKQLQRILLFLEIDNVSDAVISNAVDYASFENMQNYEKSDIFKSDILRTDDIADRDSYKIRRGKSGGYVDYLTPPEINYLNDKIRNELSSFYSYYRS